VVTANEVHLPQGRPVHLELKSADVIHSFWVPRLGGKRDVIPARVNHLWFTPAQPGSFPGQCAEFCGDSHANMRILAVVEPAADFERWASAQRDTAPPPPPADTLALAGAELFRQPQSLCTTCHTVSGISVGVVGPNLSHVASRARIAGGMLANTPEDLARWLENPPAVKPGSLMPNVGLTPAKARAIAAYLRTLR
jgi:cytochrome c oxidase subunit 2